MAEKKSAEQAKVDEILHVPSPGDAAASSNPVVQTLLAHREIAVSNGDTGAVAAVDGELAALGVAV